MSERDELVEVMARAIHPGIWDQQENPLLSLLQIIARDRARDCIAAVESAGFRWLGKDDGR